MAFHEVQFPTDISYGSIGGPEFSTEVVQLGSAYEQRNQNWTYPRERWNVAYGVNTRALLQDLTSFFYSRCGKLHGFRFKNHDDYQVSDVELGEGDGATKTFQLIKIYTDGTETYTRKITKPVSGTVTIYVDDVDTNGVGWTVNTVTGVVTFTIAPGSGEIITADFDFDVPVRFDTDYLPINLEAYLARSADVPIVEIRI